MTDIFYTKQIADGQKAVKALMLGTGIMAGAAVLSGCRPDYRSPADRVIARAETDLANPLKYADNKPTQSALASSLQRQLYSTQTGKMESVLGKISSGLYGEWRSLWCDDSRRNGLLRRLRNADGEEMFFVRQDLVDKYRQNEDGKDVRVEKNDLVVSESVYWMLTATRLPYLGISTMDTQDFFDGMLRGMSALTELGSQNPDNPAAISNFPAYSGKLVYEAEGQLALQYDDTRLDANGRPINTVNSAADADHDLVMALLQARDNVRKGIWQDRIIKWRGVEYNYSGLYEELRAALENEYHDLDGLSVLHPSEDYTADSAARNLRFDYLRPGQCFAFAEDLLAEAAQEEDAAEKKILEEEAQRWIARGQAGMDIYLACLDTGIGNPGYIPAQGWLTVEQTAAGRIIHIEANGRQSYDGSRGPLNIAAGLRYPQYWTGSVRQQEMLKQYVRHWNGYTNLQLDAVSFWPLALALGETNTADYITDALAANLSRNGLYPGTYVDIPRDDPVYDADGKQIGFTQRIQSSYFGASYSAHVLTDMLFPYDPDARSAKALNRRPSGDLLERAQRVADGQYYRQLGALGFVFHNNLRDVAGINMEELLPTGWQLVTSEGLSYELLNALADYQNPQLKESAKARVQALVKTMIYFSALNHRATDTTLLLLPWAVAVSPDGQDFRILQAPGQPDLGKASAPDADLLILAGLIKVKEFGLGDAVTNYVIHRYAEALLKHDTRLYQSADGRWLRFLNAGGYRGAEQDPYADAELVEFYTSYQITSAMQIIQQYFQRDKSKDASTLDIGSAQTISKGDDSLAAGFDQLLAGTADMLNRIGQLYTDETTQKLTADYPDKLWFSLNNQDHTLQILLPKKNDAHYNDYYQFFRPVISREASWRLAWAGIDTPHAATFEENEAFYYNHYIKLINEKIAFLASDGAELNGRLPFFSTSARFDILDAVYNNTDLAQGPESFLRWWPAGEFSLLRDQLYPLNNYQPSGLPPNKTLLGELRSGNWIMPERPAPRNSIMGAFPFLRGLFTGQGPAAARNPLALNNFLNQVLDLTNSPEHINEANSHYKRIIIQCLQDDSLLQGDDTYIMLADINVNGPGTKKNHAYLIQNYIDFLDARGSSPADIVQTINELLSLSRKPYNIVEQALHYHKLLYWDELSIADKAELRQYIYAYSSAEEDAYTTGRRNPYYLRELYDRLNAPPANERAERSMRIIVEGLVIDTGITDKDDPHYLTVQSFVPAMTAAKKPQLFEVSQKLKDRVMSDLINRDVKDILQRYPLEHLTGSAGKENIAQLKKELEDYIEKTVPAEYSLRVLIPILFLDNGYDAAGYKLPDPVPDSLKIYFASKFLRKIDLENRTIGNKRFNNREEQTEYRRVFREYFDLLWTSYKLMISNQGGQSVTAVLQAYEQGNSLDLQEVNSNILKLYRMVNIIIRLPAVNVQNAVILPEEDALIDLFGAKLAPELYFDLYSWDYMRMLADVLNNFYWLAYDVLRLPESAVGAENYNFYKQLKQTTLNIMAEYERLNPQGCRSYYKLHGVITRIRLQEKVTDTLQRQALTEAEYQDIVDDLRMRQRNAERMGQTEECAYYLATEAFIYTTARLMNVYTIDDETKFGQMDDEQGIPVTDYSIPKYGRSGQEIYEQDIQNNPIVEKYDYIHRIVQNMRLDINNVYASTSGAAFTFTDSEEEPVGMERSVELSEEEYNEWRKGLGL
jgi:hypothetical protein